MNFIIAFFRDVLDGPLYIVVVVLCSILICSCIGYLGEQYLNKKKSNQIGNAVDEELNSSTPVNQGNINQTIDSISTDANDINSNITGISNHQATVTNSQPAVNQNQNN